MSLGKSDLGEYKLQNSADSCSCSEKVMRTPIIARALTPSRVQAMPARSLCYMGFEFHVHDAGKTSLE